jgi:hypothetical protein
MLLAEKNKQFRDRLLQLSRSELLAIIEQQNPELILHINRIEWVFSNKLTHLTWPDGTPINERQLSHEELSYLVDPPFEVDDELTKMGLSAEQQYQAHIAADAVLWIRHMLKVEPRAYQILMMRNPRLRKLLRAGRRLGKTHMMAMLILHWAFTHNDARILVIAPMKSHVELIFQQVMQFAGLNGIVRSAITRSPTSPQFLIEMSNGSTIRFFTTGMRSGGKTDVARGQEAHLIILDELDYMAPEDLDAIYVMLQKTDKNQPDKVLIGASTPTGLRERFWKWAHSKRFQEFWFPSYCNPEWTQEIEDEFHEEYTEMVYRHEVEADWGESVEGVYPRRYVDAAFNTGLLIGEEDADYERIRELSDWEYSFDAVSAKSVFVMGIDWDKYGAGTNITILEICGKNYDPRFQEGRIRVVFREETPKEEYSLLGAVERIKYLNSIFRPAHIYVDKGFGETQIEMLHKWGAEHPETGLRKSVKGVAFGGTIEVRDPGTKKMEKKHMKPFMVENLRFMLERARLAFPSHDEDLYLQLVSYVVLRTSQDGRPVFETAGSVPDHAHDSLILACLAITENYDELLKSKISKLAITVPGENLTPLGPATLETGRPGKTKQNTNRIRRTMSLGVKMGRGHIKRRSF